MNYNGPFWRSNSAIFIIIKSLKEIYQKLIEYKNESNLIEPILDKYFEKYEEFYEKFYKGNYEENNTTDKVMQEFSDITNALDDLELDIKCAVDTSILMSCIDLEGRINMFCYFNLGEVNTDVIETLSLVKKMEVAHGILNLNNFRGTKPYESLNSLVRWRNLYVHGKCTDMSNENLRKNHLESPDNYPDLEQEVKDCLIYLNNYIIVSNHIKEISEHEYTSGSLSQNEEIEYWFKKIENLI